MKSRIRRARSRVTRLSSRFVGDILAVLEPVTAVDGENRSGHVIGLAGGKIGSGISDLFRQAEATPGQLFSFGGHGLVVVVLSLAGSVDPAGLDGVHIDVMLEEFDRHGLRHRVEPGLGCAVGDAASVRDSCQDAGDEDDLARLLFLD